MGVTKRTRDEIKANAKDDKTNRDNCKMTAEKEKRRSEAWCEMR